MAFDLIKLLTDVFDPQADEVVTVACDMPRSLGEDNDAWRERRAMAGEWQRAFAALGRGRHFTTRPILTYPATGANGAQLPDTGAIAGKPAPIRETLLESTLAVFLTEYSATAALDGLCSEKQDFRAASMPGVAKRMEQTSLAADYHEVARRCKLLAQALKNATSLEVAFSTGHRCSFDLRFRTAEMDDGFLPRGKTGDRVINLPSGETFIVPYEGEQPGAQYVPKHFTRQNYIDFFLYASAAVSYVGLSIYNKWLLDWIVGPFWLIAWVWGLPALVKVARRQPVRPRRGRSIGAE